MADTILRIIRSLPFQHSFVLAGGGGQPVDVTGYHAQLQIRTRPDGELWLNATDPALLTVGTVDGSFSLAMTSDDTAALPWDGLGMFDLVGIPPAGPPVVVDSGYVIITDLVTGSGTTPAGARPGFQAGPTSEADVTGLVADLAAATGATTAEATRATAAEAAISGSVAAEIARATAAEAALAGGVTVEAARATAAETTETTRAEAAEVAARDAAIAASEPVGTAAAAVAGIPADAQAATPSLRSLGAAPGQAAAGTDPRLADARQPVLHAPTHGTAGADPVNLAEDQVIGLLPDLAARELVANKGAAGGYAALGADGKLVSGQLPALAFNTVWPNIANQAAMLALNAEPGDIAIRTDVPGSFMLEALPAATAANWFQLPDVAGAVSSVDGMTGPVVLPADAAAATPSLRSLGVGATQAASGADARLADARTPTAHAATHAAGAADPILVTEAQVTNLLADLAARVLAGNNLSDLASAVTARANLGLGTAATQAIGAFDAAGVAAAAVAAIPNDGAAATPSRRTLGTGAAQAAAGNDSRFLPQVIATLAALASTSHQAPVVLLQGTFIAPATSFVLTAQGSGYVSGAAYSGMEVFMLVGIPVGGGNAVGGVLGEEVTQRTVGTTAGTLLAYVPLTTIMGEFASGSWAARTLITNAVAGTQYTVQLIAGEISGYDAATFPTAGETTGKAVVTPTYGLAQKDVWAVSPSTNTARRFAIGRRPNAAYEGIQSRLLYKGNLATGVLPGPIAMDKNGKLAIGNTTDKTITIIDTTANANAGAVIATTAAFGTAPADIAASPDGTGFWVATPALLTKINPTTGATITTVAVAGYTPINLICVSPNSLTVYVFTPIAPAISGVLISTGAITVVQFIANLTSMAISPDGTFIIAGGTTANAGVQKVTVPGGVLTSAKRKGAAITALSNQVAISADGKMFFSVGPLNAWYYGWTVDMAIFDGITAPGAAGSPNNTGIAVTENDGIYIAQSGGTVPAAQLFGYPGSTLYIDPAGVNSNGTYSASLMLG